jgi:uncharacterized protein (TIGR02246 family)
MSFAHQPKYREVPMNARTTLFTVPALVFALASTACQAPAQEAGPLSEEDAAAIQALVDEWTVAFNAGDVAGLVALYTDDAVRMPPNAPAYTGREAIEEAFSGLFEQFSGELTWPTEEIVVADGWAFHRGTYTARLAPVAGDDVIEESGKVIVIFQQQPNGSWKVAREIWNSDLPLPEESAEAET